MDEKRLDEWMQSADDPEAWPHVETRAELLDLIRLARLGLQFDQPETEIKRLAKLGIWAVRHGVPALEQIRDKTGRGITAAISREALAAIPESSPKTLESGEEQ